MPYVKKSGIQVSANPHLQLSPVLNKAFAVERKKRAPAEKQR
jgi:hypothetical protein